jgi:hypothetical protein
MFHKFKEHDIKDYIIYKLAQNYFNSNRKNSNFTNQEILLALLALLTIYKKAYTTKKSITRKSTFSALLSS